ncbi:MAG TPA: ABC transporter permease subunit [Solirubrobacterales bacterium]|nr:ABC transporter permease subunit [Solirubrobacterales bacterium]
MIQAVNPLGWMVVLAIIALWQLLIEVGIINFDYTPPPTEIADGLGHLVASGEMGEAVVHTLTVTVVASAIAIAAGVTLGAALGLVKPVRTYSIGTVDFLRTVPVVALMPVALLVWGASSKAEIIVASYAAGWPVVVNTMAGVQSVHPLKRDVARSFRLSRSETLYKIVLPVATPAILIGARLAIVSALVVAIVAEMLINPDGVGWGLVFSMQSLKPENMWAYAVVAGWMGYLMNAILVYAVRRGGANMGVAKA